MDQRKRCSLCVSERYGEQLTVAAAALTVCQQISELRAEFGKCGGSLKVFPNLLNPFLTYENIDSLIKIEKRLEYTYSMKLVNNVPEICSMSVLVL